MTTVSDCHPIIGDQSEEVCWRAVLEDECSFRHVKEEFQTIDMCIYAVSHGMPLECVYPKNRTFKVCMMAYMADPKCVEYIPEKVLEKMRDFGCKLSSVGSE